MALTWTDVDSSHIKSIGYDPDMEAMTVLFTNGGGGTYQNVSPEKHEDFIAADSKGSHLHQEFISKSYQHPYIRTKGD